MGGLQPMLKIDAMTLPTQVLPGHHRHCDDLFIAAEESAQRGDWAAAEPSFARFQGQMQAHFEAEEGLLFPAFEAATGMSAGPTQMMRHEHEQMRTLLAQLGAACAAHDGETCAGVAETLLMLMQQHNMKEENILYPMCDQALGAEAERLGAKIDAMLEKGHA
jgi:iron-sulfur cluster repair protein YtfE (RIC family)